MFVWDTFGFETVDQVYLNSMTYRKSQSAGKEKSKEWQVEDVLHNVSSNDGCIEKATKNLPRAVNIFEHTGECVCINIEKWRVVKGQPD